MAIKAAPAVIALLRGINVGGNKRVPMADLADLLGSLGGKDVVTYIQSGNAVLTWPSVRGPSGAPTRATIAEHEARIEEAIEARFGFEVTVMLRTITELDETIAAAPWAPGDYEPKAIHVAFAARAFDDDAIDRLRAVDSGDDAFWVGDRALYLAYAHGSGRSKLNGATIERAIGTPVTARNWTTVTALAEMGHQRSKKP